MPAMQDADGPREARFAVMSLERHVRQTLEDQSTQLVLPQELLAESVTQPRERHPERLHTMAEEKDKQEEKKLPSVAGLAEKISLKLPPAALALLWFLVSVGVHSTVAALLLSAE